MKKVFSSAALLCAALSVVFAAPKPAFQPRLAIQERPAPYVPSRPPRVSRRKAVTLESLPGVNTFEKLKNLYENEGKTPSKSDLIGFSSGWIAFADAPNKTYGTLLVGMNTPAAAGRQSGLHAKWVVVPVSNPLAGPDAYDHLTYADADMLMVSVVDNARTISDPQFLKDYAFYIIRNGRFKDNGYFFKKVRGGIVMKTTHPAQGDITYAYFFKKVIPTAQ